MKLRHNKTYVEFTDEHNGDTFIVRFDTNRKGSIYQNGIHKKTIEHRGGMAGKTKAALMIKQATDNYHPKEKTWPHGLID